MAISKFVLNNTPLMDVTGATATASDIILSKTAMIKDGSLAVGSYEGIPWDNFAAKTWYPQRVDLPETVTAITAYKFTYHTGIRTVYAPGVISVAGYALGSIGTSAARVTIVLPSVQTLGGYAASSSYIDALDLGPNFASFPANTTQGANTVKFILRRSSIVAMAAANGNNMPTTIYIPKVLYDHLGDGTSDDYLAATNWSTKGLTVDKFAPIEGSVYENAYADGTPIPTS